MSLNSDNREGNSSPVQRPLIIENVEIVEQDHGNSDHRRKHRHRRTESSEQRVLLAATQQHQHPNYPYGQPPNYGTNAYYTGAQTTQTLPHVVHYPSPPGVGVIYQQPTFNSPYQQQNEPPPYPVIPRSPRAAGSVVSDVGASPDLMATAIVADPQSSTLTMDDIEQAFRFAMNDRQMDETGYAYTGGGDAYMHPLKRDPPRSYGSIQAGTFPPRKRQQEPVVATRAPPPPPSGRRGSHRRVSSDNAMKPQVSHRRESSDNAPTSTDRIYTDPMVRRKSFEKPKHHRHSLSQGSNRSFKLQHQQQLPQRTVSNIPPQHRRVGSYHSSFGGDSVRSDISLMSYRSDIRKSAFFSGFDTRTGKAKLDYSTSRVRLVMGDRFLVHGHVYTVPTDPNVYEEYFMAIQDQEDGSLGNVNFCGCDCPQCMACRGKAELLPPRYYAICVKDDLYRQVVDEICSSRSMPCGLFFCGHHEDVSRPSILIAVFVIGTLLAGMLFVAYMVAD